MEKNYIMRSLMICSDEVTRSGENYTMRSLMICSDEVTGSGEKLHNEELNDL